MRKTSSFHLEEDIFLEILKYQHENNLSSRNIALERMVLEFKSLKKELEDKEEMLELLKSAIKSDSLIDKKPAKEDLQKKEIIKNENIRGSIFNAFDSMPDGD